MNQHAQFRELLKNKMISSTNIELRNFIHDLIPVFNKLPDVAAEVEKILDEETVRSEKYLSDILLMGIAKSNIQMLKRIKDKLKELSK